MLPDGNVIPALTLAPQGNLPFIHLPHLDGSILVVREATPGSQSKPWFTLASCYLLYQVGLSVVLQALSYGPPGPMKASWNQLPYGLYSWPPSSPAAF